MSIVVTGSASGIGAATVARLQAGGQRVIGVDLRDADVVADLSTRDGRRDAIDAVTDLAGGSLDGLVTCAGLGPVATRDWLADKVAKWWLPDDVVFIDEVPKTSVGKFSKKDLRGKFEGYQLSTA